MPWRGPGFEGELPSLGWALLEWWTEFLPSPRAPAEPLVFTDEQARQLVEWFTIDVASGRFIHRRGCSRRAKGWGKSPLEAAKAIAELAGPVRFDGWDRDDYRLTRTEIEGCLSRLARRDVEDITFAQAQVRNFARHQREALRDVETRALAAIRDWNEVIWAITTRMDPVRDTTLVDHTPIDYLDFASPTSGLGGKMGLDATSKWPGETPGAPSTKGCDFREHDGAK